MTRLETIVDRQRKSLARDAAFAVALAALYAMVVIAVVVAG
jgi:hypothetical protein